MHSSPSAYSSKFYNVKLLRNYVAYLREKCGWPDEKVEQLFELCGRDISCLNADDFWFDQSMADLFQEKLQQMTGDKEVAYKVGCYAFSAYTKGIAGRLAQSLISPKVLFKNIGKYSMAYSRGAVIRAVQVGSTKAVLQSQPVEGCEEKPFQCLNRKGILEAAAAYLGGGKAKLEEKKCLHRGDHYCEYEITWENRLNFPAALPAGITGVFAAPLFFLGTRQPVLSFLAALSLGQFVYFFLAFRENRRLRAMVREKDGALQESLRLFQRRYDENTLKQNILFNSFHDASLGEICGSAVKTIKDHMKYDRVMVLLADSERNILKTAATAGLAGDIKELMEMAEFNINPDNTQGFFINVLNTKAPLFLRDAQKRMNQLSYRSRRLLKLLGTKAFIAVPIMASGQALGVLAVENTDESRPLVNDDMDLLMEVAKLMGHFIPNARNFEAVRKSEKLAKVLEEQERQLRKTFQKFVPGEAVSRLSHFGSEFQSVQKRTVDVMFVDVVGFTTFSEQLQPEEVADVLNTYIDEVQKTVNRHNGKINKIIGDGLLIYFDGKETDSLMAGYAILKCVETINSRLRDKGYAPISLGVGAHRGVCTLGLIGTDERLDYTLIGDTVNVAARIESYTRHTGPNTFCFSSALAGEARGFKYVSKGKVSLKGRKVSVEIFQLIRPRRHGFPGPGRARVAGQAKRLSEMASLTKADH